MGYCIVYGYIVDTSMHLRISTVRRKNKVYRYAQLVESYRREKDGMPAHRVVASLGRVTKEQGENLKRAFRANKQGKTVVLAGDAADILAAQKCQANYRYLGLAVYLALWQKWRLGPLLDELVPDSDVEVPVAKVLAALVLQRCFAPDTKLAAVNWFPETALPELLDLPPSRFNNTRIHRALEALEVIERPLQERLSRRIAADTGPFQVLYLDCTDTWFVGQGPDMATRGRTKEGHYRRQIGIALLCDHDGLPLRWATVEGDQDERQTMLDLLTDVAQEPWAQQVPFVMDRAMGRRSAICSLHHLGLRFITAVPVNELRAYSDQIPLGAFDEVWNETDEADDAARLERLADRAVELGLTTARQGLFMQDLGIVARDGARTTDHTPLQRSRAQAALLLALRADALRQQQRLSGAELADDWEITPRQLQRWLALLKLSDPVQSRILAAGEADRVPVKVLTAIAQLDASEQDAALDDAIEEAGAGDALLPLNALARLTAAEPLQVRAVATFRPELFVQHRGAAEERLASLQASVDELNEQLRSPYSRRDRDQVVGEVDRLLRRWTLRGVVDAQVTTVEDEVYQVAWTVDDEAWRARRATDGFTLLIAHPEHVGAARDLVGMYFDKDKVEKGFRTIKSVLDLRPVHHRTDHKVRAHVSLCALGLLLERTLQRDLRDAGLEMTARTARRHLRTCFLNRYDDTPVYLATRPTPDQLTLLEALDLEHLVDDQAISDRITPR